MGLWCGAVARRVAGAVKNSCCISTLPCQQKRMSIMVSVKLFGESEENYELPSNATVKSLKDMITQKWGIPAEQVRVIAAQGNKVLKDDMGFSDPKNLKVKVVHQEIGGSSA